MTKTRLVRIATWLAAVGTIAASRVDGAVVVLENQTAAKVTFELHWPTGQDTRHVLAGGDLVPVGINSSVSISFESGGQPVRQLLQSNSIYRFIGSGTKIELSALTLPRMENVDPKEASAGPNHAQTGPPKAVYSVPVKLMVDDQEPTAQAVWEKRLRSRLAAASDIFERHCRVRFHVVAVERWVADRTIHDFTQSIMDFEAKVQPGEARLVLGFTGPYRWAPGEGRVGGSRGPLQPYILIREALVKVSEMERLEVLVHELGHYLGAVHAGGDSVMRPTLGDRRSCVRGFRIGFDAPNTLAMYLLGEELRTRPVYALGQLPAESKDSMRRVYAWLAKTLPTDPAAPRYLALLNMHAPKPSANAGPLD
jgi:hypothetical protein